VRELAGILAPDERERAERFHFERLRWRFVVGRGVLRIILAGYLGTAPAGVRIAYGLRGKPRLADGHGDALRFNLAHSGGLALYAVTRGRELGVDLEEVRPLEDAEAIAARYFSAGEAAALGALPHADRLAGFFRCWTRKEAYVKARGEGLAIPLHQFDVSVAPDEPARLLGSRREPGDADRWSLVGLSPAPGYAGALAIEGRGWSLSCWQWTPQP
jgi:4'-phosphopantetheinyl transferase